MQIKGHRIRIVLTLADSVQSLPFYFVFVGQSHGGVKTRLFLFRFLFLSFVFSLSSSRWMGHRSDSGYSAVCPERARTPHSTYNITHTHTHIITYWAQNTQHCQNTHTQCHDGVTFFSPSDPDLRQTSAKKQWGINMMWCESITSRLSISLTDQSHHSPAHLFSIGSQDRGSWIHGSKLSTIKSSWSDSEQCR